ncbi:MAG: hypothetical protein Q4G22_04640 [Paracoccus sp. (in: a-proteobacteria)]|uniref:hypothetical protein n=1 Tax=Paracoccus sp. TaxID=267 RepID=UPI0026E051ED|nr:hypothetical protein [Paracoccus sp. (in: a-proteobacteria)]MDO5631106.1 hypothetical protein [Paracoccus sp. (in: a-proteobacteria)]
MSRPNCDAAELARSLLAELPDAERVELMTELLVSLNGPAAINLLNGARAALNEHIGDIIAEMFGGDL